MNLNVLLEKLFYTKYLLYLSSQNSNVYLSSQYVKHLMKDLPECRQIDYFIFIMFVIVISQENMTFLFICQVHVFHLRD